MRVEEAAAGGEHDVALTGLLSLSSVNGSLICCAMHCAKSYAPIYSSSPFAVTMTLPLLLLLLLLLLFLMVLLLFLLVLFLLIISSFSSHSPSLLVPLLLLIPLPSVHVRGHSNHSTALPLHGYTFNRWWK